MVRSLIRVLFYVQLILSVNFIANSVVLASSDFKPVSETAFLEYEINFTGENPDTSSSPSARASNQLEESLTDIHIVGDHNFTEIANLHDWSGTGTSEDPFIIENYSNLENILIVDTDYHFVIRNNILRSNYEGNLVMSPAIHLVECSNVKITNNTIENYDTGLKFYSLTNAELKVTDNLLKDNRYGMEIGTTTYAYIEDVFDRSDYSPKNIALTVTGNKIAGNEYIGIKIESNSYSIITDNEISSEENSRAVFIFNSPHTAFKDNILHNSYLDIEGTTINDFHHEISGNTINGFPLTYISDQKEFQATLNISQLIAVNCEKIIIEGLDFNNDSVPISIAFSKDIQINNNDFNKFKDITTSLVTLCQALTIIDSRDILISNNTISQSFKNGVRVKSSHNLTINGNDVCNNSENGLFLDTVENAVIENNLVTHNGDNGISLTRCTDIRIARNNISYNQNHGIKSLDSKVTVSDNFIGHNLGAGIGFYENDDITMIENTFVNNQGGDTTILTRFMFGFKSTLVSLFLIAIATSYRKRRRIKS